MEGRKDKIVACHQGWRLERVKTRKKEKKQAAVFRVTIKDGRGVGCYRDSNLMTASCERIILCNRMKMVRIVCTVKLAATGYKQ